MIKALIFVSHNNKLDIDNTNFIAVLSRIGILNRKMQIFELILLGISLSFDTFAVSISTGLVKNSINFWQGVRVALVFGFFHTLMPFLGWLGGNQLEHLIANVDHWIAFSLLFLLGMKMILDSFKKEEEKDFNPLLFKVLLGVGIAISIDALVVGVSLALIDTNIYLASIIIGFSTFIVAMIGMLLGKKTQGRLGRRVEILGGLILIGIGIKVLVEHLGQSPM